MKRENCQVCKLWKVDPGRKCRQHFEPIPHFPDQELTTKEEKSFAHSHRELIGKWT